MFTLQPAWITAVSTFSDAQATSDLRSVACEQPGHIVAVRNSYSSLIIHLVTRNLHVMRMVAKCLDRQEIEQCLHDAFPLLHEITQC